MIKPAADAVEQQAGAVAQQVREQAIHPAKDAAQQVPRQAAQALEQQVLQPGAQALASNARPTAEKVALQVVDPAVGLVQVSSPLQDKIRAQRAGRAPVWCYEHVSQNEGGMQRQVPRAPARPPVGTREGTRCSWRSPSGERN